MPPRVSRPDLLRGLHDQAGRPGLAPRAWPRARAAGGGTPWRRGHGDQPGRCLVHGSAPPHGKARVGGRVVIRTLIVDDDFRVAALHRAYVEKVPGFSVVGEAGTGAEALRLIAQSKPDLLLLDIYLPDISGLEVMRTIREAGAARVDVIAITAARDVESLRSAMHGGVVHYLIKPFRFAALQEKCKLKPRLNRGPRQLTSP